MNLTFVQICQLLEASGLSWRAESVDHRDGRYWTFSSWRHDPGRFYADAKSAISALEASREVYEKAHVILEITG